MKRQKAEPAATRSPAPSPSRPTSVEADGVAPDMTAIVGVNLRRLRKDRGLSLEALAQSSGVSRAMLGQIELAQSAPTINVLWKIAHALAVPFSALISGRPTGTTALLPLTASRVLTSHDGSFRSRALFPMDEPRRVELYELRLAGRAVEKSNPHPPGTTENLVVSRGKLELLVGDEVHKLGEGDAILFEADVPHSYSNPGASETLMYLVMTYADRG